MPITKWSATVGDHRVHVVERTVNNHPTHQVEVLKLVEMGITSHPTEEAAIDSAIDVVRTLSKSV